MSGSNRGIYIVATIAAFAFFGLGVAGESRCQREYYSNNAENNATNATNSQSSRFDRGWLPCLVERETANPYINDANEKEQRDLAAQEAMALWAFWVAAFAGFTALVTSTGTILIWQQVSLTRKAVTDTGNATVAMQDANAIAQAGLEIQQDSVENIERPYLFPVIDSFTMNPETKLPVSFVTHFENFGRTPAIIKRHGVIGNLLGPIKHDDNVADLVDRAKTANDFRTVAVLATGGRTQPFRSHIATAPRDDDMQEPPLEDTVAHLMADFEYTDFRGKLWHGNARFMFIRELGQFYLVEHGETQPSPKPVQK